MINNEEDDEIKDGLNNLENVMQRVFKLMEEMTMRMTKLENMKWKIYNNWMKMNNYIFKMIEKTNKHNNDIIKIA